MHGENGGSKRPPYNRIEVVLWNETKYIIFPQGLL